MFPKISDEVAAAIGRSPSGIATLDVLESLRLTDRSTLKTTISRLNKAGRIIRLKRGVYSANPLKDPFAAAQATFNGYLGFSSALYLHKLTTEIPFRIIVVTRRLSKLRQLGPYEFLAVALGGKAVGFETRGGYVLSSRPKTLFDCLYLPKYGIGWQKLADAYALVKMTENEWYEFGAYCENFLTGKRASTMAEAAKRMRRHKKWK